MPALTTCTQPGCPRGVVAGRCDEHRRERDRERGSGTARGYGQAHEALARSYQQAMAQGARYRCWRCRRPLGIRRRLDWVLGHCDADRDRYHGPECPRCNNAVAGRDPGVCPHPSHARSNG